MKKKKASIPEVEKLRSFKERSGWSYQKISIHMKINAQTIYYWLAGTYKPSSLALEKLQRFLEVYAY